MKRIKKEDVVSRIRLARESLFESKSLRQVADYLEETSFSKAIPHYRQMVVQLVKVIANERLNTAFEVVNLIEKYLNQKPKEANKREKLVASKAV
jgi:hypothetical protein